MILFKNADVYAPKHLGRRDVLVCGGRIEAVGEDAGSLTPPVKNWRLV